MKRILTLLFVLCTLCAQAGDPMGTSLGVIGPMTPENLAEVRDAGFEYLEVTFHKFTNRKVNEDCYAEAFALRNTIRQSGLKVWSCHLPFGKKCDISSPDPAIRERACAYLERMIRLAAIFNPQYLILHPGSKPASEEERPEREKWSANSICRLSLAAREIGAVLCVENMPHSIGRTGEELLRLIEDCPEVKICFDTNHMLLESHADFLKSAGSRIATIHMSDFDGKDEQHWCPGKGIVDWPAVRSGLKEAGYQGVWMYEVRNGNATVRELADVYKNVICK